MKLWQKQKKSQTPSRELEFFPLSSRKRKSNSKFAQEERNLKVFADTHVQTTSEIFGTVNMKTEQQIPTRWRYKNMFESKRKAEGRGKGKGKREIGSEALAETKKIANTPAGNRTDSHGLKE